MISILIPTWKNYEYLKLCIDSIIENTFVEYEILVYINEADNNTIELLNNYSYLRYIASSENNGISIPYNILRKIAKYDWLVVSNDDFVYLPDWDTELFNGIHKYNLRDDFWLCSTMIEPWGKPNIGVIKSDYGVDIENFQYGKLLSEYRGLKSKDFKNSSCHPLLVKSSTWDKFEGFDEDVFALVSDIFLFKRAYNSGVKDFIQIGSSKVYHFMMRTTKRFMHDDKKPQTKDDALELFEKKYGMTTREWSQKLKRTEI